MPDRTPFLLRLDPEVLGALRKWSEDDLRSLNGQIEYLLRRALADAHRLPRARSGSNESPPDVPADGTRRGE